MKLKQLLIESWRNFLTDIDDIIVLYTVCNSLHDDKVDITDLSIIKDSNSSNELTRIAISRHRNNPSAIWLIRQKSSLSHDDIENMKQKIIDTLEHNR